MLYVIYIAPILTLATLFEPLPMCVLVRNHYTLFNHKSPALSVCSCISSYTVHNAIIGSQYHGQSPMAIPPAQYGYGNPAMFYGYHPQMYPGYVSQ